MGNACSKRDDQGYESCGMPYLCAVWRRALEGQNVCIPPDKESREAALGICMDAPCQRPVVVVAQELKGM